MAFGFIKKVFSFGKKEVVEEKIDEQAPLPPIKWESLEALKSEAKSPLVEAEASAGVTERADAPEVPPAVEADISAPSPDLKGEESESKPIDLVPEPEPALPMPIPAAEPAVRPAPEPEGEEPELGPEPAEAAPSLEQEAHTPSTDEPVSPPLPAERVPPPEEITAFSTETSTSPPAEALAPKSVSEATPDVPVELTTAVPEPAAYPEALPAGEMPPPIRQPSPVESDPLLDEIAPEIAPLPPVVPTADTALEISQAVHSPSVPAEGDRTAVAAPAAVPVTNEEALPEASVAPALGRVTVAKAVEKKAEFEKVPEREPRASWFQRLKQGLSRSSKELSSNIAGVFTKRKLDEDTLQDLEDVLIRADLGMETAIRITDALASGRYGKDVSEAEVRTIMAQEVEKVLTPVALPLELDLSHKPHVILVVGVNGTGKTTTIGKLAAKLVTGGLSVTLAAGDTFRAAAIEQLKIWGERTGSPVVASKLGADAAGLAYDAFQKAKDAGSDVLIIDTAGRLQNKAELMAELEKIVRVLGKLDPEAPHTVLLTVDATTGQNALSQVEIFRNVAGVNGLVMTKLDGTARGGILVAIAAKHRLPVYFIGVGEQVDDLEPFSAGDFAKAIAGVG